jgi:hypothetical protein
MNLNHRRRRWLVNVAVLFCALAAPALAQPVPAGTSITVYADPT